jgi:hypothetical protein
VTSSLRLHSLFSAHRMCGACALLRGDKAHPLDRGNAAGQHALIADERVARRSAASSRADGGNGDVHNVSLGFEALDLVERDPLSEVGRSTNLGGAELASDDGGREHDA